MATTTASDRYIPFDASPTDPVRDEGLAVEQVMQAMSNLFGVNRAVLGSEFRNKVRETIQAHIRNRTRFRANNRRYRAGRDKPSEMTLRCSTLRAVMDGRLPGVPSPLPHIPSASKCLVDQFLMLLDVVETMACEYVETLLEEQKEEVQIEMNELRKLTGTSKAPRLLGAVYQISMSSRKGKAVEQETVVS